MFAIITKTNPVFPVYSDSQTVDKEIVSRTPYYNSKHFRTSQDICSGRFFNSAPTMGVILRVKVPRTLSNALNHFYSFVFNYKYNLIDLPKPFYLDRNNCTQMSLSF